MAIFILKVIFAEESGVAKEAIFILKVIFTELARVAKKRYLF